MLLQHLIGLLKSPCIVREGVLCPV